MPDPSPFVTDFGIVSQMKADGATCDKIRECVTMRERAQPQQTRDPAKTRKNGVKTARERAGEGRERGALSQNVIKSTLISCENVQYRVKSAAGEAGEGPLRAYTCITHDGFLWGLWPNSISLTRAYIGSLSRLSRGYIVV